MTDVSDSRQPREDGADDQNIAQQFKGWLRTILGGKADLSARDALEELIETGAAADDGEDKRATGERQLLTNILKVRDRTTVDAMVPRADIVAVPHDISLTDLLARFLEEGHSRMPVYRETLDDVLGMVHIKDLLGCVTGQRPYDLQGILRELMVVAPSMRVLDLLLRMRESHQHMALVVDEFGGIDGLVTIEDLVEEIVGEINDEHDLAADPTQVVARPDGTLVVDARMVLEDFQAYLERAWGTTPFTQDDLEEVDTLGGLVFTLAGRVPSKGETFTHDGGLTLEVVEADPRRIKRVRVHRAQAAANGGAPADRERVRETADAP